jgi:hypothetical protein
MNIASDPGGTLTGRNLMAVVQHAKTSTWSGRAVGREPSQRHEFLWQMGDERRLALALSERRFQVNLHAWSLRKFRN